MLQFNLQRILTNCLTKNVLFYQKQRSTKFISEFCFELNKKTYKIIIEYLKINKDQKGEKQIKYNDLWPEKIDDLRLRAEIADIPTSIFKKANKDTSQAYNLLMQSLTDPSLKKLIRYERIRDLYQFISEIILNRKKQKKEKNKKQRIKQIVKSFSFNQTIKIKTINKIEKNIILTQIKNISSEWTIKQQRYLCLIYTERSLFKCCQKLKQKFGQSLKWNTTKKVFIKAEQIFQKTLRKAVRSHKLKQILDELKMNRQMLANQIINKKPIEIERKLFKYQRSHSQIKKLKNLNEVKRQIKTFFKKKENTLKLNDQDKIKTEDIENQKQSKYHESKQENAVKTQIKIEEIFQEENSVIHKE